MEETPDERLAKLEKVSATLAKNMIAFEGYRQGLAGEAMAGRLLLTALITSHPDPGAVLNVFDSVTASFQMQQVSEGEGPLFAALRSSIEAHRTLLVQLAQRAG